MAGCALSFRVLSSSEIYSDLVQATPTVNLVNDYSRFVIAFFEVISTSAPHIYHSALPSSPQTSIVRKLHESCIRPLARVVCGLPISWEPAVTAAMHSGYITKVAWSSCSRFIAVGLLDTTEILDAVTFERLHTFEHPWPKCMKTEWLSFSPDSRSLTRFSSGDYGLTTWDLQTGGQISATPPMPGAFSKYFSSAYSMDGKIVAIAYNDLYNTAATVISTYNLLLGTHIHSHRVSEGRIVASIWTHGELLRFATVKSGSISIWEVEFTSEHRLTEIETFPAPEDIGSGKYLFLPALSRLAFTLEAAVLVWDARDSKFLLNSTSCVLPKGLSFSSDGRFFTCETRYREVHLWKESPTGYVLHRKFAFRIEESLYTSGSLSPNGESVIACTDKETRLWRTTDPITSLSSVPTRSAKQTEFILEFSQDGSLAVAARLGDNTTTIIDLGSGNPRLIIDAGTGIYGLGVTRNTVVVVSDEKFIAWNLPAEDGVLDVIANVNDSVWTTPFNHPTQPPTRLHSASISPNFNYIAIARKDVGSLEMYDMSTGKYLAGIRSIDMPESRLCFTPDEQEVWSVSGSYGERGWKIVRDVDVVGLKRRRKTDSIPDGLPWRPYRVRRALDGWMPNSRGTRLMWMPHRREVYLGYSWSGRFLGFLDKELSEPIILELGE